ncbi:MAG TPA: hypothetical protein DDX01_03625, partial [Holosporales bacterium]|nr:hypothetical protein [Holosporales bacterium]
PYQKRAGEIGVVLAKMRVKGVDGRFPRVTGLDATQSGGGMHATFFNLRDKDLFLFSLFASFITL